MKRFFILITAIFLFIFSIGAFAGGNYEPDDVETDASVPTIGSLSALNCAAAILIDAESGTVLYEQNPDELRHPASITKVMTLILVMEEIESGHLKLSDTVTASTKASQMGGSQIYLKEHEQMTVNELLKAVCVASANDASVALAEHIAGSEEAFVSKMNEKAKALGLENTTFVNCCGLDVDGHMSTARDIALMSRELLKHDLIREYSVIWMDSLRDGKFDLVNTNRLIRFYSGATGLKTGSTDLAKNCISASALRNDVELIAVILGAPSGNIRFEEATKLLDYGFANYEKVSLDSSETFFIPVKKGVKKEVTAKIKNSGGILLPKGKANEITREIILPDCVLAPVEQNQTVGEAVYSLDGEVIMRLPVITEEGVLKAGFLFYLSSIWKAVTG